MSAATLFIHVTDNDFEQKCNEMRAQGQVFVVKFGGIGCGPCEALKKNLEQDPLVTQGRVAILEVDVEESPQTAGNYGVMGIPVLLLLNENGKMVERRVGPQKPKDVTKILELALQK
jgi:thioredoxin 1